MENSISSTCLPTLPLDLLVHNFLILCCLHFGRRESNLDQSSVGSPISIRAGASDATGFSTGQEMAVMHGSAKVEVEPIMPTWPTCRGLPTNATPDQIPNSESSSEGLQDIVQVLQDYDARELNGSSKFEVKVKGYSRKPSVCRSGEVSVYLISLFAS